MPAAIVERWPAIRALLLAVMLFFHAVAAAPLPHRVTDDDLRNPVTIEEIAAWARRLTALGVPIAATDLGAQVQAVSAQIADLHHALEAPSDPLFRLTGTDQGWALFSNPDTHPARLQIRVRRQGERTFDVLFQHLDDDHDWWAGTLTYRRLRGVYDAGGMKSKPRKPYVRFGKWVGRRVLDEFPDVEAVEVRTLRTHTTLPGEPPDARFEVRHVVKTERTP